MQTNLSLKIGSIPGSIIDNHDETIGVFNRNKFSDESVLHIDGHLDLGNISISEENINKFWIGNFNTVLLYRNLAKEIIVYNPHDIDLFYTKKEDISVKSNEISYNKSKAINYSNSEDFIKIFGIGKVINIDLDAFCCSKLVTPFFGENIKISDYLVKETIKGWESRLESTINFMEKANVEPKHIIIARSQGESSIKYHGDYMKQYVPEDLVDTVQEATIEKLRELY